MIERMQHLDLIEVYGNRRARDLHRPLRLALLPLFLGLFLLLCLLRLRIAAATASSQLVQQVLNTNNEKRETGAK